MNLVAPFCSEYQRARWVRVDLHLHSPGAHTFKFPSGFSRITIERGLSDRNVERLISRGILKRRGPGGQP